MVVLSLIGIFKISRCDSMKTNYEIRYAANPSDIKAYDTTRLREQFLIPLLFVPNEITIVYSLYDRMVVGGGMPVNETLELETINPLEADYFTAKREIGFINVGGTGVIQVNDTKYQLEYKEALYIGSGDKKITLMSVDPSKPARFYFNSTVAPISYPDKKITRGDAKITETGSLESGNHRIILKMITKETMPTCQLEMGITELLPGSMWKSLGSHKHNRFMEVFLYFELPEGQSVCHFIGEPDETRHIWLQSQQAVLSPEWSVHAACGTSNYSFIWGKGGENLDYGDQDFYQYTNLR